MFFGIKIDNIQSYALNFASLGLNIKIKIERVRKKHLTIQKIFIRFGSFKMVPEL